MARILSATLGDPRELREADLGAAVNDAHVTRKVLQSTEAAIVLGFHLDDSAGEFELVCAKMDDRTFVLFRFCGVQRFKRIGGAFDRLQDVGTTFVARDVEGTWLVETVRTAKPGARRAVSISLGHAFGGIELEYEDVTFEVVDWYGKQSGNDEWEHFELGSDRRLDFHNPFGCTWAGGR